MEPQNIGSFPHATSQSQQPPRARHSAEFEGQRNGGRDSDGSVSRLSAPHSSYAGTTNHNQKRDVTDSRKALTRPNSSFQPLPNPNSTFDPSQQARYMTDPPPIDVYGFVAPRPRPRSTAALASITAPAITPSRKSNVDAVPFTDDIKDPTPRCVRCGTDQLSGKASEAKDGRKEMATDNGQNIAASKPLSQNLPPRSAANESVTTKSSSDDQPWPPLAPPPSYSNAMRNSTQDVPDEALFGSNVSDDYEQLEKRRRSSQHMYSAMNGKDAARPTGTQPQPDPQPFDPSPPPPPPPPPPSPPLPPPPPVSTTQGATSSPYDSCKDRQPGSSSYPFLQTSSNGAYTADGDDIIELQPTDSRRDNATAADDAQRGQPSGAKKEQQQLQVTEIPHTNFAIACMVTFCFNLPLGVLAMYFSLRAVKAYQEGNAKLGEKRSRWSIVLSLLGITITTVIISSVVLYLAMQGQKRINKQKVFGTKSSINL